MAKYRTKPVEVQAERYVPGQPVPAGIVVMWGSYYLQHDSGAIPVVAGDYVVTYANGAREVCDSATFEAEFEPVLEDQLTE